MEEDGRRASVTRLDNAARGRDTDITAMFWQDIRHGARALVKSPGSRPSRSCHSPWASGLTPPSSA